MKFTFPTNSYGCTTNSYDKNRRIDKHNIHQHTSYEHIQIFKHKMYELSQILSMIQCEAGDIYM